MKPVALAWSLAALNHQENSCDQEHEEPGCRRYYTQESQPCLHIAEAWPSAVRCLCAEKRQSSEDNRRAASDNHRHSSFRSRGSPDHPEQVNAGNGSSDERAEY